MTIYIFVTICIFVTIEIWTVPSQKEAYTPAFPLRHAQKDMRLALLLADHAVCPHLYLRLIDVCITRIQGS